MSRQQTKIYCSPHHTMLQSAFRPQIFESKFLFKKRYAHNTFLKCSHWAEVVHHNCCKRTGLRQKIWALFNTCIFDKKIMALKIIKTVLFFGKKLKTLWTETFFWTSVFALCCGLLGELWNCKNAEFSGIVQKIKNAMRSFGLAQNN